MNNANRYELEAVTAAEIRAKLVKLGTMPAPYRFRLSAMVAADNRPGKVWPKVTTPEQRELSRYISERKAVGAW